MSTPVWTCQFKGKKFPSDFSTLITSRGQVLTKMTKIETNEPCPFEEETFSDFATIATIYISDISLFSLLFQYINLCKNENHSF